MGFKSNHHVFRPHNAGLIFIYLFIYFLSLTVYNFSSYALFSGIDYTVPFINWLVLLNSSNKSDPIVNRIILYSIWQKCSIINLKLSAETLVISGHAKDISYEWSGWLDLDKATSICLGLNGDRWALAQDQAISFLTALRVQAFSNHQNQAMSILYKNQQKINSKKKKCN